MNSAHSFTEGMDVPNNKNMNLYITESETTTTTEIEKEISINVDISKLDSNTQIDLLAELFRNMDDEDIEDVMDNNDRILRVILRSHVYLPNAKIRNMVYILEGDVEPEELEKDLMALIEKYKLQDEL